METATSVDAQQQPHKQILGKNTLACVVKEFIYFIYIGSMWLGLKSVSGSKFGCAYIIRTKE